MAGTADTTTEDGCTVTEDARAHHIDIKYDESKSDVAGADEKTTGDEEKTMAMMATCNANIYNAYILVSIRKDLVLDETSEHYKYWWHLQMYLGILSVFTMILQYVSMAILIGVIMLSSGNSISDWGDLDSNYTKSFLVFPFLLFCMMFAWNEMVSSAWDMNVFCFHHTALGCFVVHILPIFSDLNVRRNDLIASPKNLLKILSFFKDENFDDVKMIYVKFFEWWLGLCGSMCFYFVLAIYSTTDTWGDVLAVILNLLAFSFVLEADELAYSCFASPKIYPFLVQLNKADVNIFEMKVHVERSESFKCGSMYWMPAWTFFYAILITVILCF